LCLFQTQIFKIDKKSSTKVKLKNQVCELVISKNQPLTDRQTFKKKAH
jgi:hypothetical protein